MATGRGSNSMLTSIYMYIHKIKDTRGMVLHDENRQNRSLEPKLFLYLVAELFYKDIFTHIRKFCRYLPLFIVC